MSIFFNYNGSLVNSTQNVLSPDNRSFRYGDGLFETIHFNNGKLLFKDDHFTRLFSGLDILGFHLDKKFTDEMLENEIIRLAEINGHSKAARIRLTLFRKESEIADPDISTPAYIIQSWPLPVNAATSDIFSLGILPGIFKSCDKLANLKTNNFLPYIMAMLHAKTNGYSECLVLNAHKRICDASRGNIFIIKENIICTPPLSEGCIDGVMRKNIISLLQSEKYNVLEKTLDVEKLLKAEEIFITNVLTGIQPVTHFQNSAYKTTQACLLKLLIQSTFIK